MGYGGIHLIEMSPAVFSTTAARWMRTTRQSAASSRGPTIRHLRRKLRRVRHHITRRYHALHEYARIYHALAAREAKGSERKLILRCLAEEADVRVERVEISMRRFRVAHSLPCGNMVPPPDPLVSTALAD